MNLRKINKLEAELRAVLKSPSSRSSTYMRSLAKQVERKMVNRGKEPTFERHDPPPLPPLTIPGHPGDLSIGVVRSVANQLLNDLDEWRLHLQQQE
ncbi:hypothetical protein [Ramlibacter tataouinensis]|uniref:hypothetical protein n=1 Tax=Ramlibacter tataouinensis TaxID=94132 RepID=UPI0011800BE3|nr:hypothetical protein [Ramlibacter tataouinensis]